MNYKNYKKIFKICKKILLKNKNSLYISSINELYLIRPHPIFLNNYKIFFKKNFYIKSLFLYFFNISKLTTYIFLNLFKKKKNKIKNTNIKNIFFSHFLNPKDEKKEINEDIYFSHIIKNIDQKKSVIVALNHTKKNYYNSKNKIILDTNLKLFLELRIFYKLIISSLYLIKLCIFSKKKSYRKFYFFLFSRCVSINTYKNILIYYQAKEIFKLLNPINVVVTFEGHPFERNIFKACNNHSALIKKFAFHHSIPFQNQSAYLIKLKNGSDPDIILASGKFSYKKFKDSSKDFKRSTFLVGSNRISNKKYIKKFKSHKHKSCLVIPEGIEEEFDFFLNFCLEYSEKYNNIKFLFRLHPALRHNLKNSFIYKKLKKNKLIIFSNNSDPTKDFELCNFCLYRGSSLIFDAIKFNLKAFYLKKKNEIIFDPLSVKGKKEINNNYINNIDELFIKTKKKHKNNYKQFEDAYTRADSKVIKSFFN